MYWVVVGGGIVVGPYGDTLLPTTALRIGELWHLLCHIMRHKTYSQILHYTLNPQEKFDPNVGESILCFGNTNSTSVLVFPAQ